jgi:hypothetical protein
MQIHDRNWDLNMAYFINQMDDAGLPAPWAVQATTTTTVIPIMTQTPTVGNAPVSAIPSTAHTGNPISITSWSPPYSGSTRRSKHGQPKKPRRQIEFKCMRMHFPGDENIIPLYLPEESAPEPKVASTLDIGQLEISTSKQDMASTPNPGGLSSDLDMKVLRAENEGHHKFMEHLEDRTDCLSDDEYKEPELNPKYSSDMFTITDVNIYNTNLKSQISKGLSAPNYLFSSDLVDQVPILFDLGTAKSLIKPIPAYTEYIRLPEVITIGNNPEVKIVGIGLVVGLKDVLQPESLTTPALLSFTNYLESWPNSIVLINSGKATIYETSRDKCYRSTAELREDIPNLQIIAEFTQMGNMYVAPNYNFPYTRGTNHTKSITRPNIYKVNQKIHIGMMEVMDQHYTTLDQTLQQIASNEFTYTSVLQITQTNQNFVSLDCETDLEVNLIESEKKDLLLAPAIDEEAQKESAHDSGASSCLIGFQEVFHNYKQQQIPNRTAGDTIYAAAIGSVGLLQNVIHVPGIQKQLLSLSQICNQLNYYYLIDGNKCEVLNSNNETIHTCIRNNSLYTTRDLFWIGID